MNTSFQRHNKAQYKDEWLTPKWMLEKLGPFDLDPCAPIIRPWEMAAKHYTRQDNGLLQPWEGFIWCNPPYTPSVSKMFIARLKDHNNGLLYIYSRTETKVWHDLIFPFASSVFFLLDRYPFFTVDGIEGDRPGSGSALISFGIIKSLVYG